MWYHYDVSKQKIFIETSKHSKKIQNLENNKIVYFLVDEPFPAYKGIRRKGKVKIYNDINTVLLVCEQHMKKYLGRLDHQMAKELINLAKNGESVAIEISPLYFSTWNDSKINQK